MTTFSEYIKYARAQHKLSKSELARRIGTVPQYVTDIEKGNIIPSEDRIEILIGILELDKPLAYKLADKLPTDLVEQVKKSFYQQATEIDFGE